MAENINFNISGSGSDDVIRRVNGIFDALKKATAQQKLLNQQLDVLRDRSAGNRDRKKNLIEELTGDPTKNKEAFSLLKSGIKSLDKEIKDLGKSLGSISGSLPGSALAKHRAEIKKLENAYYELAKAGKAGSQEAKNLINQISAQSKQINTALTAVNKAKNAGKETTSKSEGLFGNFGDALSNIFKFQAASFVIDTLAKTFTYAAETVINFEAELANLGAILDKEGQTAFEDIKTQALVLGQTTAFTATEVIKLQTELIKLGFTGKEVLNVTAPVVDFSTAVRESADAVALLTGATLKAFNLSVLETRRVVDVLTQGTIDTALSFGYLETALPIVSSAAAAANISLEETVSVLGVLADRGVQASTSATAFRNILIESAQRGLNYRQALELLQNSTNKLSVAFDLFGKRGAVQALILAENIGEVTAQTKRLEDRLITAREISKKQLDSMRGDVTLLKSAWDGLLLSIGDTDVFRDATQSLTDILNGISSLISGTVTLGDAYKDISGLSIVFGAGLLRGFTTAAKLQNEYNLILRTSSEYVQDLALAEKELFQKANGVEFLTARNKQLFIQQETYKVIAELKKQGINDQNTLNDAARTVAKQINGVFETIQSSKDDLKKTELSEADILKIDPKSQTTLMSLNSLLSELKSIQERTTIGSEKFNLVQRKIDETEKLIGKTRKDNAKSSEGYLDGLVKKLSEYEKALLNARTVEAKQGILIDIKDTETKLNTQLELNKEFFRKLTDLQLQESSQPIKNARYKLEKESFDQLENLEIQRYKSQLKGEAETQAAISQIQNKYALEYQTLILRTNKSTTDAYQDALKQVKELGAESFKLNVELQKIKFDNLVDKNAAEYALKITKEITNEALRKQLIDQSTDVRDLIKVNSELSTLKALREIYKVSSALTGVNAELSADDKARVTALELQELSLKRQAAILKAQVESNSARAGNEAELKYIQDVINLQQQYLAGNIPAQDFNLLTGEQDKNPFEVMTTQIENLTLKWQEEAAKRALADIEAVNASLLAQGLLTDEDNIKKFKAEQLYLDAKAKATDAASKDELNQQKLINREMLNQRRQLVQEFLKISQTFGEAMGAALVNEEGTKEAFKDLMKSLIDIYIQFLVAQLSAELTKEGATLNFVKVATIGLGIAALGALGGALKASIDKFEQGGVIPEKFAEGGVVNGPSHKNGGVKYRVKNTNFFPELEGGETVINKKSSRLFRKELSRINSYNGYGKRFADGGIIQNAPQVLNPSDTSIGLSDDSLMKQATLIAERVTEGQLTVMAEQNSQLVVALKQALDFNNRLTERLQKAQQNSRI